MRTRVFSPAGRTAVVVGGLLASLSLHAAAPSVPAPDAPGLRPEEIRRIDAFVGDTLKTQHVPSASLAVVVDGRIAFVKAYGKAQTQPPRPATTATRYEIGSVSKEFLGAGMALLDAEQKLSLDDTVAKHEPNPGPPGPATLRQLLSHTAGVRDYWPQDYLLPAMREPVTRQQLLDRWARQPLDFAPGTQWQYSNTGYALAGDILERQTRQPLFDFLKTRFFDPLGMTGVVDVDRGHLGPEDAVGYTATGYGPLRPAPPTGSGWLFAAAELGMTAEDLARWDLALIEGTALPPTAYRNLTTETLLANGAGTHYGLGLFVTLRGGQRVLTHDGETIGFISLNAIYPERRVAIVVLTNSNATNAAAPIGNRLEKWLLYDHDPRDVATTAADRQVFEQLRRGRLDRSRLTDNGNASFDDETLRATSKALRKFGPLKTFELNQRSARGGLDIRRYTAKNAKGTALGVTTMVWPDGQIEQFTIDPHG